MNELSDKDRPHQFELDCSEVLADLWVYLDQECDTKRGQVLRKHLDDCSPCLERLGVERQLKELLHRKCGGDFAPEQLRERLRASIRQVSSCDGSVQLSGASVEIERSTGLDSVD